MTNEPAANELLKESQEFRPLSEKFYLQPTLDAARAAIGHLLVRLEDEGEPGRMTIGRIVETEAYLTGDPASHAFRGPTPRSAPMFGSPGHAYVYLIYGMHHCLNLVTGPSGIGEAILIRAVEPIEGLEEMRRRRGTTLDTALTSGPARVCQAFGIDLTMNGENLMRGSRLRTVEGPGPQGPVEARTRIGLSNAEAAAHPWRFVEAGSRFLSRK